MTSRAALQSTHESVPVEVEPIEINTPNAAAADDYLSPILDNPARQLFGDRPSPSPPPAGPSTAADESSVHARDASALLSRNRDEVVRT